jgi:hypothetical protein
MSKYGGVTNLNRVPLADGALTAAGNPPTVTTTPSWNAGPEVVKKCVSATSSTTSDPAVTNRNRPLVRDGWGTLPVTVRVTSASWKYGKYTSRVDTCTLTVDASVLNWDREPRVDRRAHVRSYVLVPSPLTPS